MADMVSTQVVTASNAVSLTAGQQILIQVLNADGTVASTVYQAAVPAGMSGAGNASVYITLT